jgi:FkbM family methyltransferase
MKVERGGEVFEVMDDPQTALWRFWQDHFSPGTWESETLAAFDKFLEPGHTMIDIGAWVGPTVLWASRRCAQVVAVEPDPTACAVLRENLRLNAMVGVSVIEAAAVAEIPAGGEVSLRTQGAFGDSMSTLIPGPGESVIVGTITVPEILAPAKAVGTIGLVKIDIEGGEAALFPPNADLLRSLNCPIVLGLHLPWITNPSDLLASVGTFKITVLDDHPTFPTLLLLP